VDAVEVEEAVVVEVAVEADAVEIVAVAEAEDGASRGLLDTRRETAMNKIPTRELQIAQLDRKPGRGQARQGDGQGYGTPYAEGARD
jgi:hypothetical protein